LPSLRGRAELKDAFTVDADALIARSKTCRCAESECAQVVKSELNLIQLEPLTPGNANFACRQWAVRPSMQVYL
jgi:hypothetical protein